MLTVHLNFSHMQSRWVMDEQNTQETRFPSPLWMLNMKHSWMSEQNYLKINCLQLKQWWVNLLNMCNAASWAHHSWPVDFGERSSRPQNAMCTPSILYECSKLPLFKSRHVCHLIVFNPYISPPFCIFMPINCVLSAATCTLAIVGPSWLKDSGCTHFYKRTLSLSQS